MSASTNSAEMERQMSMTSNGIDELKSEGQERTVLGTTIEAVRDRIGAWLAIEALPANLDPAVEDAHWRESISQKPYFEKKLTYENDYTPAIAFAYVMRPMYRDWPIERAADELSSYWPLAKAKSALNWAQVSQVVTDAWQRMDESAPKKPAAEPEQVN